MYGWMDISDQLMKVFCEDIFIPTRHSDVFSFALRFVEFYVTWNQSKQPSITLTERCGNVWKRAEISPVSFCSRGVKFSARITVWDRAVVPAAVLVALKWRWKYDEIHFTWHDTAPRHCHMLLLSLLREPLQSSICHSLSFSSCILPGRTKGGLRNAAAAKY